MKKKRNCVTWIQTALYSLQKNIYVDIAKDVETRFDNSNYLLGIQLPKGKNKTVIGLMNDELGVKIMKQFVALRTKTYNYLTDNNNEDKKTKSTKKFVKKKKA